MEIFVHPYIPMILPTSSQCGTLFVYPTILPSNKGPSSLPSNDYPSVHSLPTRILRSNALEAHALHGTTPTSRACSKQALHGSHRDITGARHLRSTFRGFLHLANFELGSDTTCKGL